MSDDTIERARLDMRQRHLDAWKAPVLTEREKHVALIMSADASFNPRGKSDDELRGKSELIATRLQSAKVAETRILDWVARNGLAKVRELAK